MKDKDEEGTYRRRYYEMINSEKTKKLSTVEESSRVIKLPKAKSKFKEVRKYILKKKYVKSILVIP